MKVTVCDVVNSFLAIGERELGLANATRINIIGRHKNCTLRDDIVKTVRPFVLNFFTVLLRWINPTHSGFCRKCHVFLTCMRANVYTSLQSDTPTLVIHKVSILSKRLGFLTNLRPDRYTVCSCLRIKR